MNIKDILKKDDGSYKCLENNKDYKTFDGLQNILNTKYKMTIIDYAIKWKLVKEDEYIKCEICKSYCVEKVLRGGDGTYYLVNEVPEAQIIEDEVQS